MSHFAVIVAGPDPDASLAPYHEFECTGIEDEFVVNVDVTEEYRKEAGDTPLAEYLEGDGFEIVKEGEVAKNRFRFAVADTEGQIVSAYKRTNPNAKWDWYVIGGRCAGFLKTKDGEAVNQCLKKDIDVDGMRNTAEQKASIEYGEAMKIIGHLPPNKTWKELLEAYPNDISKAREEYWIQPRCAALIKTSDTWGLHPDEFLVSREEYLKNARNKAITTYAAVDLDGTWRAKGKMGWLGMSNNDMTEQEWARQFNEWFDSLPDETLITVVDCHI